VDDAVESRIGNGLLTGTTIDDGTGWSWPGFVDS